MRLLRRFALAAVATLVVALLAFDVVAGQRLHDLEHPGSTHECAICILGTADNSDTPLVSGVPVYIPIVRLAASRSTQLGPHRDLLTFDARGPPSLARS